MIEFFVNTYRHSAVDYEQVTARFDFNDISYLKMDKIHLRSIDLPLHLEVLVMSGCRLMDFPPIWNCPQIKEVTLENMKIADFPDVDFTRCSRLEKLVLTYSDISFVNWILPDSLRTLNLSYNMIKELHLGTNTHKSKIVAMDISGNFLTDIPECLDKFPVSCKFNIRENDFFFNKYALANAKFIVKGKLSQIQIHRIHRFYPLANIEHHLDDEVITYQGSIPLDPIITTVIHDLPLLTNGSIEGEGAAVASDSNRPVQMLNIDGSYSSNPGKTVEITYDSNQTVHMVSIDASIQKSIGIILRLTHNAKIDKTFHKHIWRSLWLRLFSWNLLKWFKRLTILKDLKNYLADVTDSAAVFTDYGLTFSELLQRILFIIDRNPARSNLMQLLMIELEDSKHVCMTGKIGRITSCLAGFVPGIEISISTGEELQNKLLHLARKYENKYWDTSVAQEAHDILVQNAIYENTAEYEAWMETLRDRVYHS